METILVTGGAGAIGSNLSNSLASEGYNVIVIDNLTSGIETDLDSAITFIQGDIANLDDMEKAFSHAPDRVFHLAAFFANQNSVDHPQDDLESNGRGILNILTLARTHKVKKVLYTSSSCVYGNLEDMIESTCADQFDTPYAITKFLGEKYCHLWSDLHGLDTVILRLFNSYGPGERPGRYRNVIPNFMQKALAGEPLPLTGTGDEIRDFNFVADTVQGISKAMFADTKPGSIFNVSSGKGTRIRDLAEKINAITGNTGGIEFKERRAWDTIATRIGNMNKAHQELGYEPQVALDQGLELTYRWFNEAGIR